MASLLVQMETRRIT